MKITSLLIAAILVLGIFLASGCIETGPLTKGETPTETEAPAKTPTELELKIGETAKTSVLEVTVLSAERKEGYVSMIVPEYPMAQAPSPGNIFLFVEAEIKNIGNDKVFVGSSDFSAMDSEGMRYDPEIYSESDALEMFKELYKNQKTKGKLLFEIPKGATGLEVLYDFGNLFIGTKLAKWEIE